MYILYEVMQSYVLLLFIVALYICCQTDIIDIYRNIGVYKFSGYKLLYLLSLSLQVQEIRVLTFVSAFSVFTSSGNINFCVCFLCLYKFRKYGY